jgi:molecular chaperone GrpE (heat shock protein)
MGKIRVEIIRMQKRAQASAHQPGTQQPHQGMSTYNEPSEDPNMPKVLKYLETLLRETKSFMPELSTLRSELKTDFSDDLVKEILQVIDSFNRVFTAMEAAGDDAHLKGWFSGMKQIYNTLILVLKKHGYEEMNVIGKPFDPKMHAAIGTVKDPSMPDGTIVKVERVGVMRAGFVIRFPEVVVVRN